jgi:GntR family transcriptional regulator
MTSRSQYRQLADTLRAAIVRGDYPPGSQLTSEPELAEQYGVSRPTVNRALAILSNEGLVRPERGRGTFIHELPVMARAAVQRYARPEREADGQARGAFDGEVRRLGFEPRSELIEVGPVVAPGDVAEALHLGAEDVALIRKRHMYASDVPVQLATSYVPWTIAGGTRLTEADTGPGGTYSRLAELGHPVARFTERVTVRTPSPEEEDFLRLTEEQKVFSIFHLAFDQDGRPVEVTVHTLPTHQWVLDYAWPIDPS